ncbi:MAG: universal stress protein [Alphaproteobacteria bacterium]|nr:universal stress protein [Alphaproteobacteria bacterium]
MPLRILVPVDGSDHAAKAVDLAAEMARAGGGELHLIHAATERPLSPDEQRLAEIEYVGELQDDASMRQMIAQGGEPDLLAPRIIARLRANEAAVRRAIGQRLLDEARARAEANGAKVGDAIIESGDPATVIMAAAKRLGVDHIVMGARGLGNLGGIVLGSVSQKVIHLAGCPCTIVK